MTPTVHTLYKRLLVAVLICVASMGAGIGAFVYFFHPVALAQTRPVQQIEHGTIESDPITTESSFVPGTVSPVTGDELKLQTGTQDSDYIWIPIPDGISSNDIVIENHYMDRQLWVAVIGADAAYYNEHPISGNLSGISEAMAVENEDRLVLRFTFDRVYEYNTIFENGVLYVDPRLPGEIYDRIVIVDPAGAVPDEYMRDDALSPAAICLGIATELQTRLENAGIRVYMTSVDERIRSGEECLTFASEIRPDMYIRIETAYADDTLVYGTETVYNGTYFIPGFGSVELADYLEAYVTTAIGGKALGLTEAGEDDIVIRGATVPAATVRVGYYTNAQENILMCREDYRARIAEGMFNAVMHAYGD